MERDRDAFALELGPEQGGEPDPGYGVRVQRVAAVSVPTFGGAPGDVAVRGRKSSPNRI